MITMIYDLDNYPEVTEKLDEPEHEAYVAYLDNHHEEPDASNIADFRESYNGTFRSMESFAEDLVESLGEVGSDSFVSYYIDYTKLANDLEMDYWTSDSSCGGVHVFR